MLEKIAHGKAYTGAEYATFLEPPTHRVISYRKEHWPLRKFHLPIPWSIYTVIYTPSAFGHTYHVECLAWALTNPNNKQTRIVAPLLPNTNSTFDEPETVCWGSTKTIIDGDKKPIQDKLCLETISEFWQSEFNDELEDYTLLAPWKQLKERAKAKHTSPWQIWEKLDHKELAKLAWKTRCSTLKGYLNKVDSFCTDDYY